MTVCCRWNLSVLAVLFTLIFLSLSAPALTTERVLTDQTISDTVEDELLFDEAVTSHKVDVSTEDGIVTLDGAVANLLAKERAAKIAETVKGVRAVINRIEVVPPRTRSDKEIKKDIEEALLWDPATESYEITVDVKNNAVTLLGRVQSWQEKDLCGRVAKGVKGVIGVRNEIAVAYPEERSDQALEAEIEQALRWNAQVDDGLITVNVNNGKVTLSGTVGSASEKTEAAFTAHVGGVRSVDATDLDVKFWAREDALRKDKYVLRTDEEIRKAVEDALFYDPRINSFEIRTEVSNGIVTLRGEVDHPAAGRAATRDAHNTVGVLDVENRIKIRPPGIVSDQEVQGRVRRALLRHPYIETYEITVDVVDGVVKLYGVVDSYFEKSQADLMASRTKGVFAVDNYLRVRENKESYPYNPYVDDYVEYDWYRPEPSSTMKSDAEIKQNIEDELWWSPFVDEDDVKVVVEGGRATLTGTVGSWSEYSAAVQNAHEGGATWVDNRLEVD